MRSPIATLFDAADAPGLRERVAELEATVTALTAQVAKLERENKRLQSGYEFYFAAFAAQQVAAADKIFGLTDGAA